MLPDAQTSWRIVEGDCIAVMAAMPEATVDAIVCDPPYGIGFMGKVWDGPAIAAAAQRDRETRKSLGPESASRPGRAQARSSSAFGDKAIIAGPVSAGRDFQEWCEAWAREALRVLKPGGYLLAFGGGRNYHRLAVGVEDAGFEIRDMIEWLYGSGFPKSLDVSKAIDKAAGAEREVLAEGAPIKRMIPGADQNRTGSWIKDNGREFVPTDTAPATAEAAQWEGWGTALKPAHEPIVLARKPFGRTVAANVLGHGTGALNIDACRIDGEERPARALDRRDGLNAVYGASMGGSRADGTTSEGRWPANVVLDEGAAAMLDEQTGTLTSGAFNGVVQKARATQVSKGAEQERVRADRAGDSGGASRFFYCAKADTAERNAGLATATLFTPTDAPDSNDHPTVKPIDVMRWLVRLVTPPGGTVLDPFTGSGSTGCAAVLEGFHFIGIEQEAAYVSIARARLAHWSAGITEEAA